MYVQDQSFFIIFAEEKTLIASIWFIVHQSASQKGSSPSSFL